ncbi:folylpolyglutamate synthase, mitochondrial-like isoform X2 [Bombyx mandarina]|uniref:Folylpolyglutamate synthase n=1 Tax=Bombyx mandarina TaxID=7092 RepID=A0A6J2JJ43_BOMMA|nr:folylpolyglutamate synthase, mitochondrial-like isoform X2 [Bombyx mandarina]
MNSIGLCRSYLLNRITVRMCSYYEKCTNLEDMENYLSRTGVTMSKLDELSVVHVAGTKGKGSTSAMCESILRHHGFRTGFYSSPHLVAVRERVRLDGRVISEDMFAKYFHDVHQRLEDTQKFEGDMPKYFAFLTVMAYNIFLKEKVDVAIVEVGIGGLVDYTNILRKVPVVGITALGLDHTSILGNTLQEIAASKAGIMKRGCEAYTVQQPNEAMDVLIQYADSLKCPLTVVPDYDLYSFETSQKARLPVELTAYRTNASLAIQLAHAWMRKKHENKKNSMNGVHNGLITSKMVVELPPSTCQGLGKCQWPGRYQVINADYAKFYLDGAHTKESMEICAQWFSDNNRSPNRILLFSATGDRNAEVLLQPLKCLNFTKVYFVTPTAYKETNQNNDNYSLVEQEELISRCKAYKQIWNKTLRSTSEVAVMECVSSALVNIKQTQGALGTPSVLITGSLHLVGAALSILDPCLNKSYCS